MSWQWPNIGSRVTREGHARFWERPKVRFLRATRHQRRFKRKPRTSAYPPIPEVSPASHRLATNPVDAERGAADGGELCQAAGALRRSPPISEAWQGRSRRFTTVRATSSILEVSAMGRRAVHVSVN